MPEAAHIAAQAHSMCHRAEIEASEKCGCYYCLTIVPRSAIHQWVVEPQHLGGETALCPKCEIDSVIGSASGYPITREFLEQMQAHWFAGREARR